MAGIGEDEGVVISVPKKRVYTIRVKVPSKSGEYQWIIMLPEAEDDSPECLAKVLRLLACQIEELGLPSAHHD